MPSEIGPCRLCGHTVPTSATRCRSCGYEVDPERDEAMAFAYGLCGGFLVLTLAFAPIGLACLWKATGHYRALTRGVAATGDHRSLGDRVDATVPVERLFDADADWIATGDAGES